MVARAIKKLAEIPHLHFSDAQALILERHGLERLLMQLLGLPNLRLATLFPRDLSRLTP